MNEKEKIEQILNTYGMTGVKASQIMGISANLFRAKKCNKTRNKFNLTDLTKLENYLKLIK